MSLGEFENCVPFSLGDSEREVVDNLQELKKRLSCCNDDEEIRSIRAALVEAARHTRAQLQEKDVDVDVEKNENQWTPIAASELGLVLRHADNLLNHFAKDLDKAKDDSNGVIEEKQSLLPVGETGTFELEILDDPREEAMRLLAKDGYQHEVNMAVFMRTMFGWCFIVLFCHSPWFISIVIALRRFYISASYEENSEFTCNGLETFLFGFIWLLTINILLNIIVSLSTSVDHGRSW